jgi:predicted HTH transcriptional regulator
MALNDIDFDALGEAELAAAIGEGLRCGIEVAFAPEAFELPFLKEVASLANTRGGHLLIGIDGKGGVASGFAALTGSAEDELRRLVNLAHTGIAPPIAGLQAKAVSLAGGGFVIVIRVPASRHAPHYTRNPRTGRCSLIYARNLWGAYEVHPRALSDGLFGQPPAPKRR